MLDSPHFNERVSSEIAGDDPLGLAPVNERLYGAAFPGINNFVRHIRVYSALAWQVRNIERYLEKHAKSLTQQQAREVSDQALQKIELAITWANKDSHLGGLVGVRRKFPEHDRPIEMTFATFGDGTTSYLDAVFYRPSLTNGLRFLEARAGDSYGCTPAGNVLADAFEDHANRHEKYSWLADVTRNRCRQSDIASLRSILDLTRPTHAERDAFLGRFYPEKITDESQFTDVNRSQSITLVLRAIDALGERRDQAVSEEAVRAAMARGRVSKNRPIALDGVAEPQAWWAVLQLRQYERLAFDTLFAVVERVLGVQTARSKTISIEAVAELVGTAAQRSLGRDGERTVGAFRMQIKRRQGSAPDLYTAALEEPSVDVFGRRTELAAAKLDLTASGAVPAAGLAILGLIYCAAEAENLSTNPRMVEALDADPDKASLAWLADLVSKWTDRSVAEFAAYVVQHLVILRHFEVVTERSRRPDGKNRFRFLLGDYGLQRYDASLKPMRPSEAEDRLHFALLLMVQVGLLTVSSGSYRLTQTGKSRLRRENG